jgi:hypothetical protein
LLKRKKTEGQLIITDTWLVFRGTLDGFCAETSIQRRDIPRACSSWRSCSPLTPPIRIQTTSHHARSVPSAASQQAQRWQDLGPAVVDQGAERRGDLNFCYPQAAVATSVEQLAQGGGCARDEFIFNNG